MALVNRVTQLFKADAHAVLDQLEEPEQLLRQAVRDMEEEFVQAERRIKRLAEETDAQEKRRTELRTRLGEIDEELDLVFAKGEQDLARGLVRRKLEAERLEKRLKAKLEARQERLTSAQTELEERRLALDSMRQKAAVFAAPAGEQTPQDDAAFMLRELAVSEQEVDVAFLREQEKRGSA